MKQIRIWGIGLFLLGLWVLSMALFSSQHTFRLSLVENCVQQPAHRPIIYKYVESLDGRKFVSNVDFLAALHPALLRAQTELAALAQNPDTGFERWQIELSDYTLQTYEFHFAKYSTTRVPMGNTWLAWLTLGAATLGALVYIVATGYHADGFRPDGVVSHAATARGWLGIVAGLYLTAFYILLYWLPQYLTTATLLVDGLSRALTGEDASQWFLYGVLYCLAMVVMGLRMALKYRHNRYQLLRTASVVFFQLAFAFMLPNIMYAMKQPYMDLKLAFPLDYDYFADYKINEKIGQGANLGFARLGTLMFVWGLVLSLVLIPLGTYWFGKRWYCSWVCGCGGLAETLGDPYRQLSDKSLRAWQIERYSINIVLVSVVVMTVAVLLRLDMGFVNHYQLRDWYAFGIGAAFAGVIGVGFYPLMGGRVWCRFGCPLAAIMGIVQKYKSRFRITTNGGQCISCGNCSAFCEMGIDVRAYAQRGQNIVRASCVGCGICAEVCPRGVLRLENASEDSHDRTPLPDGLRISTNGITLLDS